MKNTIIIIFKVFRIIGISIIIVNQILIFGLCYSNQEEIKNIIIENKKVKKAIKILIPAHIKLNIKVSEYIINNKLENINAKQKAMQVKLITNSLKLRHLMLTRKDIKNDLNSLKQELCIQTNNARRDYTIFNN